MFYIFKNTRLKSYKNLQLYIYIHQKKNIKIIFCKSVIKLLFIILLFELKFVSIVVITKKLEAIKRPPQFFIEQHNNDGELWNSDLSTS